MSSSATNGQKRKRTPSETPPEAAPALGFVGKVVAMEEHFAIMLKNCQKEIIQSEKTQGSIITCCAMYTFEKDIQEIQSLQMNDYGMGKLEQARMGFTGEEILPVPRWMESGVALQAYFERKVKTNRAHSSGDADKRGFEVPWRASIQLENVPAGCTVASVQLSFINPASNGSPTITMYTSDPYIINDKLINIKGQTYSECCRELGIFRQGYCYIKLEVPLHLLIREQLKHLRTSFPRNSEAEADFSDDVNNDNVILRCGRSSMKVDRRLLTDISTDTRAIFGTKLVGQVNMHGMDVSKDAVVALLGAVKAQTDYLLLDAERSTPSFMFELAALAVDWNVQSVKLWTQLALLERLCVPGVNLQKFPVDKLLRLIRHDYDLDKMRSGVKMVLLGFTFVLRDMMRDDYSLRNAIAEISSDPALQEIFRPAEFMERMLRSQRGRRQMDSRSKMQARVSLHFLHGSVALLTVAKYDSVENMKAQIERRHGIPVDQQILTLDGRPLEGGRTLEDCNIRDGDQIFLMERLKGC